MAGVEIQDRRSQRIQGWEDTNIAKEVPICEMRTLQVFFSPKSGSTNKSKVGLQIHTLGEVQQYDLGEEFCTLIYFQKRESWNENLCTSPCGSNISTTYPGEQTIWHPIKSTIVMFF